MKGYEVYAKLVEDTRNVLTQVKIHVAIEVMVVVGLVAAAVIWWKLKGRDWCVYEAEDQN